MKKTILITLAFSLCVVVGLSVRPGATPATDNSQPDQITVTDQAAEAAEDPAVTQLAFDHDTYDFGKVPADKPVRHTFRFRNTGSSPYKITRVKPSCQCTAADYSKDEIPVGGEGYVTAEYNAKNRGVFKKSIVVTGNTEPGNKILYITGEVVE